MTSRNRTNKFVTVNGKLSPAERNDIKSLIVKPGKIGGYVLVGTKIIKIMLGLFQSVSKRAMQAGPTHWEE